MYPATDTGFTTWHWADNRFCNRDHVCEVLGSYLEQKIHSDDAERKNKKIGV